MPEVPQTQRQSPDQRLRVFFSGSCRAQELVSGTLLVCINSSWTALCSAFRVLFPAARLQAVAQTRSAAIRVGAGLGKGFAGLGAPQQEQEGNDSFNLSALAAPGLQN